MSSSNLEQFGNVSHPLFAQVAHAHAAALAAAAQVLPLTSSRTPCFTSLSAFIYIFISDIRFILAFTPSVRTSAAAI
jgi:hypothetical protein